jgi:hypothetical protein
MNCPRCDHSIPDKANFCPECGAAIPEAPELAARVEVSQQVETVQGGRVVGVDLGQVLGDVSIGNYSLTIGTMNGGVVNHATEVWQPPRLRPVPVMLLPRASTGFLDRKDEVAAATAVLEGASPVEFHAPAGVGKSALLRHLAYYRFASVFPSGVVFFSEIRHRPVEDLLLDLFDAFYERDPTYVPTPVQVRFALRDERALVVLDDVDLEKDEVEALMDAVPRSVFLLASTECCLWGEGRALPLQGLPLEDALVLMERELGWAVDAEDLPAAGALCAMLEGYPLRLLQLSAVVRDTGRSLTEVAEQIRQHAGTAPAALTELALARRTEPERRVLAALAVPAGASLKAQRVSALAGLADARPELDSLQRRGLVQEDDRGYMLAGSLEEELWRTEDLTAWAERALEHFASWADRRSEDVDALTEEADSVLGILEWGVEASSWAEVLRLGRAFEGALTAVGQWGAWERVLGWELEAARALGDRAAEGWILHQLGTRALCLDDTPVARENLSEALGLRESLGDWEGAAVTRHNLALFGVPGGPDEPTQESVEVGSSDGSVDFAVGGANAPVGWAVIVGLIVVVVGALILTGGSPSWAESTFLGRLLSGEDKPVSEPSTNGEGRSSPNGQRQTPPAEQPQSSPAENPDRNVTPPNAPPDAPPAAKLTEPELTPDSKSEPTPDNKEGNTGEPTPEPTVAPAPGPTPEPTVTPPPDEPAPSTPPDEPPPSTPPDEPPPDEPPPSAPPDEPPPSTPPDEPPPDEPPPSAPPDEPPPSAPPTEPPATTPPTSTATPTP